MMIKEVLNSEIVGLHKLDGTEVCAGVSCDSREVNAGDLFFAMKGLKRDGSDFIPDAIKSGAVAVVVEKLKDPTYPQVLVRDINRAYGIACARIFKEPSRNLIIIGITGTNGKTTIAYMIESVLKEAGISTGVIGTTGYRFAGKNIPAELTTPDARRLNELLYEMADNNVKAVAMEVSSHALELGRVWGIHFDIGVFTNLTRDHLDFHGTMEAYFKSKNKLFSLYLPLSGKSKLFAVINNDVPFSKRITLGDERIKRIGYGIEEDSEIRAIRIKSEGLYSDVVVRINRDEIPIRINLTGRHNVYNALACIGACYALGIEEKYIKRGLENLHSVPGRLEPVPNKYGIRVFVDYAHTPDALENVILALKETAGGRIITVFGCGGDRDRGKREIMGEIAGRHSDVTIITSDNPRTEDPDAIIGEIEKGILRTGVIKINPEDNLSDVTKSYITLADRREAIELSLRIAGEGDTVLIAGKGHEDYQIIGTEKIHFSDREVAEKFFAEKDRNAGGAQN